MLLSLVELTEGSYDVTDLQFSESFVSLQQEGHLIRSCIATGLNSLIAAHVGDKGAYYTAFFQLSIGLERAMKVIFIMDHMASNGRQRPTTAILKGYGHRLVDLIQSMRRVLSTKTPHPLEGVQSGSIEWEILEHLSEFSIGARYFNLNHGATVILQADPLARWNCILTRILSEDVPAGQRQCLEAQAVAVADAIKDHSAFLVHGLDRSLLSAKDAIALPALTSLAGPYSAYRVLLLLLPLRDLLWEASLRVIALDHRSGATTPSVPYMQLR